MLRNEQEQFSQKVHRNLCAGFKPIKCYKIGMSLLYVLNLLRIFAYWKDNDSLNCYFICDSQYIINFKIF